MKRAIARLIRFGLRHGIFVARRFRWRREAAAIPVLMCLWNRPERLAVVMEQLDAQVGGRPVHLYLWNNRRGENAYYLSVLRGFTATGALVGADIVRSPFNLGSIARFYWASRLARRLGDSPVIVIDDDENIPPEFVSTALAAYRPDTVAAFWAFEIDDDDYYHRHFAEVGGRVDHVGPGGMVCSLSLFRDHRFFTRVPEAYWMIDDVWFTHFARHSGRRLAKLPIELEFVMAETNQHWGQAQAKADFYRLLLTSSPLDRASS